MIDPDAFPVGPWTVSEPFLRRDLLAQTETIFALSNGHIGLRGNLDEGEPHAIPGTYLAGFFETNRCHMPRRAMATRRRTDTHQRHRRQARTAARRRRTVRRAVRNADASRTRARPARRRPATRRRMDVTGRPSSPRALHAVGVVRAASRLRPFATRSSRSGLLPASWSNRRSSRTSRCRNGPRIRALRLALRAPLVERVSHAQRSRSCIGTPHAPQRLACSRPGSITSSTVRRARFPRPKARRISPA